MSPFYRDGALWLPLPQPVLPPPTPEPITIRMIGNRRMQCKDIPDDAFLDAVRRTPAFDGSTEPDKWRMRWNVQAELEKAIGPIPENLFLAKAKRLGRRRLLGGCTNCSCRGDYHIAAECRSYGCCSTDEALLGAPRVDVPEAVINTVGAVLAQYTATVATVTPRWSPFATSRGAASPAAPGRCYKASFGWVHVKPGCQCGGKLR